MRVSYGTDYFVPLPEGHPFPMGKFLALCYILLREGLIHEEEIVTPVPATWEDLRLVHTDEYLTHLKNGTLGRKAERKMGLPWSAELVHRSRVAVQGTINASLMAFEDGLAASLAGGTHHAFPGHGEGFCVLNDVAVACHLMLNEELVERILIIDLDVHQGNGTAKVFEDDERVYTFSVHGERNYPFRKETSSRDVGVTDKLNNDKYLEILSEHLPTVFEEAQPDLVYYLGGVDVHDSDRFGRLKLTRSGLHQRDRLVLEAIKHYHLPAVLLLSGGYAPTPEATADLHAITHREARRVFGHVSYSATSASKAGSRIVVRSKTETDYNIT